MVETGVRCQVTMRYAGRVGAVFPPLDTALRHCPLLTLTAVSYTTVWSGTQQRCVHDTATKGMWCGEFEVKKTLSLLQTGTEARPWKDAGCFVYQCA